MLHDLDCRFKLDLPSLPSFPLLSDVFDIHYTFSPGDLSSTNYPHSHFHRLGRSWSAVPTALTYSLELLYPIIYSYSISYPSTYTYWCEVHALSMIYCRHGFCL